MKDRKPGGALMWGVLVAGVQMVVYSVVGGVPMLLLAGLAGVLILELAVLIRADRKDWAARVLAVPAGLLGLIPRYLQSLLASHDQYGLGDGVFFAGMLAAALLYAAFLVLTYDRRAMQALRQARAVDKARGYTFELAERFYDACVQNKIIDLSRDADRQRLQLLAETKPEFQLLNVTPEALFEAGRARKEQARQADREKKLADQRSLEAAREAEEARLANLPPRAKRICQLEQIARDARARARAMLEAGAAAGALSQSLQTREKGPSFLAGMASGIGGAVPAAMTASRIERENQEIRARNAAIDAQFHSARAAAGDAWMDASAEASRWEKKAAAAKLKLTDDSRPAQALFAALTLGQPQLEETRTGAVIVSLTARSEQGYEVSGTRAVVDGAILADLCREDGEVAGQAHLCLPTEGLGTKDAKLSGICTATTPGAPYTITLRPGKLFLIER